MPKPPNTPPGKNYPTPAGTIIGKPGSPGPFSEQPGPATPHIGKDNPAGARLPDLGAPKAVKGEPRK